MNEIKWNQVLTAVIITGLIVGLFVAFVFPRKVEVDVAGTNATDCLATNQTATDCPAVDVEGCPIYPTCGEQETQSIITGGYLIDDISLGDEFYWDKYRKLNLFDGKIEFDGENYDAEERFYLTNLILKTDINDFEGYDYLTMKSGSLEYLFKLQSDLDITSIGEEDGQDTLELELLGKSVEISEWKSSEITFTQGKEYSLSAGESVMIDNKNITLEFVLNDAAYVTIEGIDSKSEKIKEGDTMKFEGIEVKAKEVLYSGYAGGYEKATLMIGTKIETTVEHGEEYEEDSIWNWIITSDTIGLTLNRNLDEREDGSSDALAPGEIICLPNNYICTLYDGLYEEVEEEYEFDLDNTGDFIVIEGKDDSELLIDEEKEDEVYIKKSDGTVYTDKNDATTEITDLTKVKFGYTDVDFIVNLTTMTIGD